MIVLAVETAAAGGSAALAVGGDLRRSELAEGVTHSRTLVPEIEALLRGAGLTVFDLDLVVAGLGPGSFTGLRIGLAAAKGLAWAAEKPLVGVPSLDGLAAAAAGAADPVCPLIDARKDQVYAALYHPESSDRPGRASDYQALAPADFPRIIDGPTVFFGPGLARWADELAEALGDDFRPGPEHWHGLDAGRLIPLARRLFEEGADTDPARSAPLYVRPPDVRRPAPPGG
jgi:tRNA threonylcarbamoyladenosine biosynthesis protein TsaB